MRLCCIGVAGSCIIMAAMALVIGHSIIMNDAEEFGNYLVENCNASISDELDYLSGVLWQAELTEEGDTTFERIGLYQGTNSHVLGLNEGRITIATPDTQAETVSVVLNRNGKLIEGVLEMSYFDSYLHGMSDRGGVGIICCSDGKVMLTSSEELAPVGASLKDLGLTSQLSKAIDGQSGTEMVKNVSAVPSGKALVTYMASGETSLYGIYAEESARLDQQFWKLAISMIVFVLIFLTAALVVSLKVSSDIGKSVTDTIARVVKLSEGDLHSPCAENKRGDETQTLADSLKKTIGMFSSYINDIDHVLSALSHGDLRVRSGVEYTGDFASIRTSLDTICAELRGTMTAIEQAGDQVLDGSQSLSSGAQMLSDNSTTEASALEEISSMAAEVASRVENNTRNTDQATALLGDIVKIVDRGSATMAQMSSAMDEIKSASDEIQSVVKVIDDIAFQTNILALNAAVEAARAGAAGKGFAVVADEVRNLASKSGEAAQSTMELVQRSGVAVDRGNGLTAETETSFRNINRSVSDFSALMDSIAVSSTEQGKAIREINQGLESITGVVQSNSAAAQQSAESSLRLMEQADILQKKVSAFKL